MTVESEDYKLEVLEYAVNQFINRLLPESNKDALSVIIYQSNEIVWRVATEIYTKSGHQIDFLFVKKILDLQIEPLRTKILEQERIKVELEAQRLAIEIEEERIRNEKKAKLDAQKQARKAEEEKIRNEREQEEQRQLQEFKKAYPDSKLNNYKELEIFTKIKKIIIEELEVNEENLTLDLVLELDLGANFSFDWRKASYMNSLEGLNFTMAIEEEFDIEILDEDLETFLSWNVGQLVNFILQKI